MGAGEKGREASEGASRSGLRLLLGRMTLTGLTLSFQKWGRRGGEGMGGAGDLWQGRGREGHSEDRASLLLMALPALRPEDVQRLPSHDGSKASQQSRLPSHYRGAGHGPSRLLAPFTIQGAPRFRSARAEGSPVSPRPSPPAPSPPAPQLPGPSPPAPACAQRPGSALRRAGRAPVPPPRVFPSQPGSSGDSGETPPAPPTRQLPTCRAGVRAPNGAATTARPPWPAELPGGAPF